MTMQRATMTVVAAAWMLVCASAAAQDRPVYRCPGNLYTDQLTPKEAIDQGCKTLDGAPITVIQAPRRVPSGGGASSGHTGGGGGNSSGGGGEGTARAASGPAPAARASGDMRVDPAQQRARDSDARRILEAELRKEEERLGALQKDFNHGEPERRGDERNAARYQERVNEMKAAIARKEADIAAIKREIGKLPGQ